VIRALRIAALVLGAASSVTAQQAPQPAQPAASAEQSADSATFTLDQVRALARAALYAGDFEIARQLAMGLLKADEEDAYAYAVLAAAHSRMNDRFLARSAARLAYRYSETRSEKFTAAHSAARIAIAQERPTLSQMWLRIAATHAETPRQDQIVERDYKRVRRVNPLYFNLRFSVAPSDNVNSGTDNVLEVNNGIPTQGRFRPTSRALSGLVTTFDAQARYRLAHSETGVTYANARLYTRRVELSDSSEEAAPNADDGDFASSYAEFGLTRTIAAGAKGNTVSFGGALGASWYGGDRSYDFAKANVGRSIQLSPATRLSLQGIAETRLSTRDDYFDSDVLTFSGNLSHRRSNGDRMHFGVTVQNVSGDFVNADYQTASLRASYTFGQKLGPAQITTGVTLGYTDYDDYRLVNVVDGGRQDDSVYGDISFFFADYDFAGFAPTVQVRTGRRSSNVNRFEIDETTITLGIQSKF